MHELCYGHISSNHGFELLQQLSCGDIFIYYWCIRIISLSELCSGYVHCDYGFFFLHELYLRHLLRGWLECVHELCDGNLFRFRGEHLLQLRSRYVSIQHWLVELLDLRYWNIPGDHWLKSL
jgi:hypothetical protein